MQVPELGMTLRDGGAVEWRRTVVVMAGTGVDVSLLGSHDDLRGIDAGGAGRVYLAGAVRFAFSGRTANSAVKVRARTLTPSLVAEAATQIDVGDDWVNNAFEIRYEIKDAAAESFRIRLPASAGDRLDVLDPYVRDITSTTADGITVWTITLRTPVTGS
jgi:hypothetical protein